MSSATQRWVAERRDNHTEDMRPTHLSHIHTRTPQVELVPGGASIAVSAENRQSYAALYARWILHGSVRDCHHQFVSKHKCPACVTLVWVVICPRLLHNCKPSKQASMTLSRGCVLCHAC